VQEAKNEQSAALSALTLEYTLEKAEMEKALMEEHTTRSANTGVKKQT
jgi:hypothetical protein